MSLPAVLTPLGAWLWWRHYDGHAALAAIALLVPIAHAYIVPGIGTNVLRVWEFDTRLRARALPAAPRFRLRQRDRAADAAGDRRRRPRIRRLADMATQRARSRPASSAPSTGSTTWSRSAPASSGSTTSPGRTGGTHGRSSSDYAPWFFGGFGLIHGGGPEARGRPAAAGPPIPSARVAVGLAPGGRDRHAADARLRRCSPICGTAITAAARSCRKRENEPWRTGSIPPISNGWRATRRGACRCRPIDHIDFSQAVRAGGVHAALLHAGLSRPASAASPALQPAVRRAHQRIHHDARGRPGRAAAVAAAPPSRTSRAIAPLVRCLDTMIEEEKEHYRCFAALNRACFPDALRARRALLLRPAVADARAVRRGRAAGRPARLRALVPHGDGGILDRARARHGPQSRHRDARRAGADLRGACTAST